MSSGAKIEIFNDFKRLTQILINLVSNALKFTQKGSITIVVCDDEEFENSIKISVKDTGCGIPYAL